MIGDIYYILGLLTLIFSFSNLYNYSKVSKIRQWYFAFEKVTGREIHRKDFRSSKDYNIFTMFSIFSFIEIIWLVFGVCTKNWPVFLIILLLEILFRVFSTKSKIKFLTKYLGLSFQFFKFVLILTLILNHFHFHQDILTIFVN